jgi:lactate dehydrogenase-like 2-hydroxyacid dehydrogenase
VNHLKANPEFRCGLDVFEDEPAMKPGLADCPNAVIVPHIASASLWTRYAVFQLRLVAPSLSVNGTDHPRDGARGWDAAQRRHGHAGC